MSLPQGADYSLTESALIPFQAEPTHFLRRDAATAKAHAVKERPLHVDRK
jgi:hypothetical protein